jgi:quercetin dioxygenase-like cupin family protein
LPEIPIERVNDDRRRHQRPAGRLRLRPRRRPGVLELRTYWRLLATSDTTSGRSTTFDELFPRGLVAPPHVHDDAEEAFFVLEGDLVFTLGDDDHEITAPPGTYVYIPPGTRHSFRCEAIIGRVYNTLVPGGFDNGITEHGTPAPKVQMRPPGTSAAHVWEQIVSGRPAVPWEQQQHDVSSW